MKRCFFVLSLVTILTLFSHNVSNAQSQEMTQKDLNKETIQAVLWMHTAAEYRALCYQAYNIGRLELDNALLNTDEHHKPFAIVTDCDNTILCDIPAQVYYIENGEPFNPTSWLKFVNEAKFKPLPGALEFFNYAASKGVEIFYVVNRIENTELEGTMRNLRSCGFPMVDKEHILLKTNTSNKQYRYDKITQDFDVLIYFGDNLGDMPIDTYQKPFHVRNERTKENKSLWGSKYIMLPNPVYGNWESALAENYHSLSPSQKSELKKSILRQEAFYD